jgi:hypothetical protein
MATSYGTRIIDIGALQVLAKNSDRCNFRLLQQYRHGPDVPILSTKVG